MPQITIDRLAFGGAGFGRLEGKACFVPYTAPGDLAEIAITRDKGSYAEAVVNSLVIPAMVRVSPPCPVFGSCGGCNWQHIDYEEQCRQKELILAETLWRAARVTPEKIRPLQRAAAPYAYRQRIQVKVHKAAGELAIGFHRPGSHFVVDIADHCPLAVTAVNAALSEVRKLVAASAEPESIPQVDLSAAADGRVAAIFHYIGTRRPEFARELVTAAKQQTVISGISVQSGRKSSLQLFFGPEQMVYTLPACKGDELEILYPPDGFSQVNFPVNRAIVAALIAFCATISTETILDLYCGNGNFSLPLARNAARVTGFESFERSVLLAGENARRNRIDNAVYACTDAAAGLEQLAAAGEFFDLVVIDPPRCGAVEVVRKLSRKNAAHVIYVSCDPPTLARDLGTLQKNGFELLQVQPVDMFPQTYHLENVAFLRALS